MLEYNPDVTMILESWAHESISDVELNLIGFKLFTNDRLCCNEDEHMLYVKEFYKRIVDDLTNVPDYESSGVNWLEPGIDWLLVSIITVFLHLL